MAFDTINIGAAPNDGTGDTLRSGGAKINANFGKAVEGPASATDGRVAVYDQTTGKLLKDGTKLEADLVVGPAAAVTDNRMVVFDQTSGRLVKQAAFVEADVARLSQTQTFTGAKTFSVDAVIHGVRVGRGAGNISNNTAVGASALATNTTGSNNTANGLAALVSNTTGSFNTANGVGALQNNTTGINNTANGWAALFTITTGSNNTAIGYDAQASSATVSNQITLGNSSIATLRCQVTTITSLSDARDKTNIAEIPAGLAFVQALRPVAFDWNMRDGGKVGVHDFGFLAQELQAAQTETGVTVPNLVYDENPEKLEAGYGALIPVLVKAIQEQQVMISELKARLDAANL